MVPPWPCITRHGVNVVLDLAHAPARIAKSLLRKQLNRKTSAVNFLISAM